ncbi:collagen-binding domain-containing protein [Glycomyces arizonensis]|uniref:collagen-binding domain-containing protein n=1 Tax=Glycomyces arizonensis TaxID=256035 RepID=UPI0003FDD5D4|nr:collagen-binding domain-containing protein [Glycomyces arizonensis]
MSNSLASARSSAPSRRQSLIGRLGIVGAVAAVGLAALAVSGTRQAALADVASLNPLDPALDFNAFIEGDTVLTEHEMEGPLATGGNLAMQGLYEIDIQDNATFFDGNDPLPSSLVVGGRMDWDGSTTAGIAKVLGNGYVKVGDLTGTEVFTTDNNGASQPTRLAPIGSVYDDPPPRVETVVRQPADTVASSPIDFGTAFADMRSYSDDLAVCANTVTMLDSREGGSPVAKGEVQENQQIYIELTDGQTNVLNVTGEDLNNMSDLTFVNAPTADRPLLINVDASATGGVFDWDVATQAGIGGAQAPYILWNFNDTTELTLIGGDSVEGSIYAPDADFTDLSATNVEGQIVAANARLGTVEFNGGETHYFPFDAELSCESDVEPSPSVTTDEPTTDEPTTDEPTTDEPTTDEPTTDEPTTDEPTTDEPTTDEPTTDEPTTDEPTTDEPTTDEPTTNMPTTDVPTTDMPTTDMPTSDMPSSEVPSSEVPTSEAPTSGAPSSEAPSSEAPDSEAPVVPDEPGGMLATTGSTLIPLGIAAVALLAAGTAVLILSKRRRRLQ